MADSPSDYAALFRSIRNTENLKLEIHQLRTQLKAAQQRVITLESQMAGFEQAIQERDARIEEFNSTVGDKSKGLVSMLKQKDETITRLQASLQNKHRELEEIKAKSGTMFKKK
jgi:predicted RNase H-like nuclease (RuvC/YqgF family)